MKYVDEFRDGRTARGLAAAIAAEAEPGRAYRIMEFCGGHTHAIARYGIQDLLPANVRLIHGPGCPVCVLPIGRIDAAIRLAREHGVMLCTYGDVMRVPASGGMSLMQAKAHGADIRMVYSASDALRLAADHPGREVVFLAIGFETTTPPTAVVLQQARAQGLANFSVFCNHVLTPAAMSAILDGPDGEALALDGFVGPGHVSTVIGTGPYRRFAAGYGKPVVVAGFEPLDVMEAVRRLLRQINAGEARVENEYARVVAEQGNTRAQALVDEVFELRDSFEWRGLGTVPCSALRLRDAFAAFDAERRFALTEERVPDHKACECAAILRGVKTPADCRIFGTACTPQNPKGACMVSAEGACAAYWSYGRFREHDTA